MFLNCHRLRESEEKNAARFYVWCVGSLYYSEVSRYMYEVQYGEQIVYTGYSSIIM